MLRVFMRSTHACYAHIYAYYVDNQIILCYYFSRKEEFMEIEEVAPKKEKLRKLSKKIHLEIAPDNWHKIKEYIVAYNRYPRRVTPEIKLENIVNDALNEYFEAKGIK
jgi:hypothetical protein